MRAYWRPPIIVFVVEYHALPSEHNQNKVRFLQQALIPALLPKGGGRKTLRTSVRAFNLIDPLPAVLPFFSKTRNDTLPGYRYLGPSRSF